VFGVHFGESIMIVTTSALDKAVQQALQTNVFSTLVDLLLFQNNIALSKATTLAQLTEATFTGYTRKASYSFAGVPILLADGTYNIQGALAQWRATGASPFVSNVLYGWAMVDHATGLVLYGAERFDQPISIIQPDDGFGLVVSINQTPPNLNSFATLIL
jgi:hypothetical protein